MGQSERMRRSDAYTRPDKPKILKDPRLCVEPKFSGHIRTCSLSESVDEIHSLPKPAFLGCHHVSLLAALNQGDSRLLYFATRPAILMEHAVIHDAGQLSDLGTIVSFSGEKTGRCRKTNGLLRSRPVKRMSVGSG